MLEEGTFTKDDPGGKNRDNPVRSSLTLPLVVVVAINPKDPWPGTLGYG